MSEWQGLWKCEKCGKSGTAMWREMVTDRGRHYLNDDEDCTGRIVPFDRRSPDPDLLALLREARDRIESSIKCWADKPNQFGCRCGRCQLVARIDAKLKEVGG